MKILKRLLCIVTLLALTACGGGNSGTSPFGNAASAPTTSTPTATATASAISLTLSKNSLSNSGTETVTATLTAVDANRNIVAGIPVTMRADNDANLQVSGLVTNSAGVVTAIVSIGSNKSNRSILVTAISGTLPPESKSIQVVGARITATALPAALSPGDPGKVQYRVSDANGNPLETTINITGPGGVQSSANTGPSGDYEFTYTAPNIAGNLNIAASAAGVENVTAVIVQSGPGVIPVVTTLVRSPSARANPSVVPVNTSAATNNRAEVRALFVGDANAPIANIRARFDLDGDRNSIGGTMSTGTTLIYSDASGVALSAYVPGPRSSPTDGVSIRVCWDYADFPAGTCPNAVTTTLTVVSEALSVTIGTDNLIVVGDLIYSQRYIVQVNDSSGLAKPDVLVSPLLDLPRYFKGFYSFDRIAEEWSQVITAPACENEDLNRNGVMETYSNGDQEDANRNGQIDPRKADVTVSVEGSTRTDANGQLKLRISYPKNIGSWDAYTLTVAASGISGTEGRASYSGVLGVPITAVQGAAEPAFRSSPYGTENSPVISIASPDGSVTGSLCTNPN